MNVEAFMAELRSRADTQQKIANDSFHKPEVRTAARASWMTLDALASAFAAGLEPVKSEETPGQD